jgi:hypothetical protein
MSKKPDRPAATPKAAPAPRLREVRPAMGDHADARGDFYYDELMTPQPDALREFHRARLLTPDGKQKK